MATDILLAALSAALIAYAIAVLTSLRRRSAARATADMGQSWNAWHSLGVLALFLAVTTVAKAAAALLVEAVGLERDTPESFALGMYVFYAFNALTVFVMAGLAAGYGRPAALLGFAGGRVGPTARAAAAAFLVFLPFQIAFPAVVQSLWVRVFGLVPSRQPALEMILKADWPVAAALAIASVTLAPFLEELIFRAFIQSGVEKSLGRAPAIVVTSVVFCTVHGEPLVAVKLLPLALALSIVYDRWRNIAVAMLLHSMFNVAGITVALAARQAGLDLGMR